MGNLTETEKEELEKQKVDLKAKLDVIQKIEDSLNEIKNEATAQPDYNDITSDNKEDIKDIIKDIENILKEEKGNLSAEEIDALEEQKKELENKVTFIEKIEKYELDSDDFVNTTDPDSNDNDGNLENKSNELINIIPLEKTEIEHIAKGEKVKVYLEVTDITESVAEEDKDLIKSEIVDKKIAVYLDLSLFKQIGNRESKKVSNTSGVVNISFKVPSNLINTNANVIRKYQIVRVHEGEIAIIDAVFNEETRELSFKTDKFSTYALIYEDVEVKVPQTGDTTSVLPWMLLSIGFGMIVFYTKNSSMNEFKQR